ncbi:unnamed protein product [Oikopleura dioica]|uniref:Uncharacterized protein n=1 Tax=Oikopleura dioica TaxID=34765 RepID=E4YUC7_OIKDI|nr:unnamed protein product [Oikopleura dioica]
MTDNYLCLLQKKRRHLEKRRPPQPFVAQNVLSESKTSKAQSGRLMKLNTRKEDLKNCLGNPVLRPRADFDSSPISFSNPMMPHTATSESNNYLSAAARLFQNPALLGGLNPALAAQLQAQLSGANSPAAIAAPPTPPQINNHSAAFDISEMIRKQSEILMQANGLQASQEASVMEVEEIPRRHSIQTYQ